MLGLEEGFRDLFQSNYFSYKETNSLGVCELYLNHTFQSRDKFPDSLFSHFSATPKCWCSSCVAVDEEIEIVSGTTGVANGHRRSWESDSQVTPLTPFPLIATIGLSFHSIPGIPLPHRVPAFSLPGSPEGKLSMLLFSQTVWWRVFEPNYMEVFIQWKEQGKRKGEIKLKCKSVKGLDPGAFFLFNQE